MRSTARLPLQQRLRPRRAKHVERLTQLPQVQQVLRLGVRTPPSPGHALQHGTAPLVSLFFFNQHGLALRRSCLAAHSQIARCDLAVPKKGPRLGICTAEAGAFPPHYVLSAGAGTQHTSAALNCTAIALPDVPQCAWGQDPQARSAQPGHTNGLARPLAVPCFLVPPFFPRQVLRGHPRAVGRQDSALAPFSVSFCVGGFLCVLPICRTAVPPLLSSAKMSLARRQLNCCRRDSLRPASLPRTGSVWVGVPPLFLTGGEVHPPPLLSALPGASTSSSSSSLPTAVALRPRDLAGPSLALPYCTALF